jgi:hypothetical protein
VTVIIDLIAIRDATGTCPARLLEMEEGRSKSVFKTLLAQRLDASRDGVEVVPIDGFTDIKTAAAEAARCCRGHGSLPAHVSGRRCPGPVPNRVRQQIHGPRGMANDPV